MESSETSEEVVFLPRSMADPSNGDYVVCSPSIVIVGANGSGKTRLGAWLEAAGPQKTRVHRIPAQRTLIFPKNTSPVGMQSALDAFQWGDRPSNWNVSTWEQNKQNRKLTIRYGDVDFDHVATAPLSDFDKLLVFLFSENYTQLLDFHRRYVETNVRLPAPETVLERVKRVWEAILPHRTIEYQSSEVLVRPLDPEAIPYLATGMSDGERVVFYLVGQCLCAASDSIIVVDEPELHLHRSIQRRLWDILEAERRDCQFVYITHDLAFAEGRTGATKIWLKGFDGSSLEWFKVEDAAVPEALYLEILGSRRAVAFIEGRYNSPDYDVYQAAYPSYFVRPVESCSSVIASTKAFGNLSEFHHLACFGVVDRDYLTDRQIEAYESSRVYAPLVAEIENLFLLPDVVKLAARQLGVNESVVKLVIDMVFSEFNRLKCEHALALTKRDISLMLGGLDGGRTIDELEDNVSVLITAPQVRDIYAIHLAEVDRLINENDYIAVLKVFNHKGLAGRVTGIFGLTSPSYVARVRQMLRTGKTGMVEAMLPFVPEPPLLSAPEQVSAPEQGQSQQNRGQSELARV